MRGCIFNTFKIEIMIEKKIARYILGSLLTVGFFLVLALLIFQGIPELNSDVIYLLIGALISGFTTVVNYFYGSSVGSADKTDLLTKNGKE